jgi:hypothetical protein
MKPRPADQVLGDVVRGLAWFPVRPGLRPDRYVRVHGPEAQVPQRIRATVRLLLTQGPYRVRPALVAGLDAGQFSADVIVLICAELALFVAALARRGTDGFGLVGRLRFQVHRTPRGDSIMIEVHGEHVQEQAHSELRDLAFLQLQGLLLAGGLRRIRVCPSLMLMQIPAELMPCGRLFVRTRKQEYCSVACQRRAAVRRKRDRDRAAAEARAQRKRRP